MSAFLPKDYRKDVEGFGGLFIPILLIQLALPFAWATAAWLARTQAPTLNIFPDLWRPPVALMLDTHQVLFYGSAALAVLSLATLIQMLRRRPSFIGFYMTEILLSLFFVICMGKLFVYVMQRNLWTILPQIPTLSADAIGIASMAYVMFSVRVANTFQERRRRR